MSYGRVFLDGVDDVVSKVGITTGELVCKGWKDIFEFPSVKKIPGTEKAGAEESAIGECSRD
jgi:hypothetical protein